MALAPLTPLTRGFTPTVASLQRVAERLVSPARKPENEIALTPTPGDETTLNGHNGDPVISEAARSMSRAIFSTLLARKI